jgi:hypothetical protein
LPTVSDQFVSQLFCVLLSSSAGVQPTRDDPNLDYNGRWDAQEGGYDAYYDPSVSLYEETPDFYDWDPVYGGGYYHYWSGDDPQRYWRH